MERPNLVFHSSVDRHLGFILFGYYDNAAMKFVYRCFVQICFHFSWVCIQEQSCQIVSPSLEFYLLVSHMRFNTANDNIWLYNSLKTKWIFPCNHFLSAQMYREFFSLSQIQGAYMGVALGRKEVATCLPRALYPPAFVLCACARVRMLSVCFHQPYF